MGIGPNFAGGCTMYGLWVNTKTGKRFVNELADRKIRADAIIREGNKCISFTDAHGYAIFTYFFGEKTMRKMTERGVVKKYDTLGEMAAAYDCPLEPSKNQLRSLTKVF